MVKNNRLAGLILAAGYSSRMKDFKPLMHIGEKNALEIQIDNLRKAGIDDIYVIIGFNADSMKSFLQNKNVKIVYNEDFAQGMFTSVKAGIRAGVASGEGYSGYLLMLVDSPMIPPYVIKNVMKHHNNNPDNFIVPGYKGKSGHPLCIPNAFVEEILAFEGDGGLKVIRNRHADTMERVEMNCRGILMDMDTPESYAEMLRYYEANKYPTRKQCETILEIAGTPAHVKRHCRMVANIALRMAYALVEKGYSINIDLVRAAGLLHDCMRVHKKHWEVGASFIEDYGYDEVAAIIRVHMSYIHPYPIREIHEKDLLCLADKLCLEDRFSSLENRMEPVRQRWADNPEAIAVMEKRINSAKRAKKHIEAIIGRTIESLMQEKDPEFKETSNKKTTRKLYLIRHGETQKHMEQIFLGQTDVPLDPEGQEQCTRAGMELKKHEIQTDKIYTSDLKRARESAKIIAKILDSRPEVVEEAAFREMALGSWDGMFIREIKEKYPEEYKIRGQNLLSYRIDENAENFYDLQKRVLKRFHEILHASDDDIIIVGHAGVNRVIMCDVLNKDLNDILHMRFPRGAIEIIDLT